MKGKKAVEIDFKSFHATHNQNIGMRFYTEISSPEISKDKL